MVLTAVEQRRVDSTKLSSADTVVAVAHDFPRSFETILGVLPATKRIVVVNGASPNEKVWRSEIQKDADRFESKVDFIWYDGLSFDAILQSCATLPPDTAIFWHLLNVDATGVEVADFAATYSSVGGGFALVGGVNGVQLRNEKGVTILLQGPKAGLELAANVSQITISLR
jgi:hypothetical protein